MAENTNGRRTFKWGDQEYLLDDLLKLHGEYEQNFYDFARDRGQYDSTALQGLNNAINTRINAAKQGKSFDGDGTLDTDVVDNTRITTQKKGVFKKEKYVDQDNTAWAKHYMSRLMSKLKPYKTQDKETSNKWDISKFGLESYLNGQGLDAQEIFEGYDLQDENNPKNPRSHQQRRSLLKEQLQNYRDWIVKKGFDFTKNDSEWDDDFVTELGKLIEDFDNKDIKDISRSLRKLGAGNAYTTAFTSGKWDLSKTDAQTQQASEETKKQKDEQQKSKYLKEWEDYAFSQKKPVVAKYYKPYNFGDDYKDFEAWYGDLNKKQQKEFGTYLGKDNNAWTNAWNQFTTSLKEGKEYTDKNLSVLLQGAFVNQPHLFTDLGNGQYLINDSVTASGQGTIYNPTNGYLGDVFLGDLAPTNEQIKNEYLRLAYDWINSNYGTNYKNQSYVFAKEGGELIQKNQLGGSVSFNWESNDAEELEALKQKAEQNNLTPEQQKARDRYIDGDNKSLNNPDAGFSASEWTRLVSVGADLTSLVLDPITGTAVGLGSSATNLVADIMDDGFQWKDVGNFAVNVGFDLLGAIPIFGDIVGTGGKVIRTLTKFGPRFMALLAGYQGVKNFDGMKQSWEKMLSTNDASKMTVQDWRNVAQSISLVTGAGRAIKNKAAQKSMKNKAKVDDVVGINVYDKQAKQVKQILVDGDVAKKINQVRGDKAQVEAELAKLEPFKDKFGATGTLEVVTKGRGPLQSPIHRVTDPNDSSKTRLQLRSWRGEGKPQINTVYDFSRVPEGYGNKWSLFKKPSSNLAEKHVKYVERLNTPNVVENHRGALTSTEVDAQIKTHRDLVDAQIEKVKAAMDSRNKGIQSLEAEVKTTTQQIKELQKKLKSVRKTDLQAELAGLHGSTKGLKTIEVELQRANEHLNSLKSQLDTVNTQLQTKGGGQSSSRLKQTKAQLESEIATGQAQITAMEAQLQSLKNAGQVRQTKEVELRGKLKEFDELRRLQRRLGNLQRNQDLSATTVHTSEYNKLQQMLSDLQTNHSNIGGRDVNWDMAEILRQANLSNAFKQGGSVNRNKINKFLNYGKG